MCTRQRIRYVPPAIVMDRGVLTSHAWMPQTFHRRNYYLRDANTHVMLVHYFDEVHKIDPGMGALVPSRTQPLPTMSSIAAATSSAVVTGPSSKGLKRALPTAFPVAMQSSPSNPPIKMDPYDDSHSVDVIMKGILRNMADTLARSGNN